MTCASCVNKIEANLASLKGIEVCNVSLPTAMATIEYIPSVIGPRDIIEKIEVTSIPVVKMTSFSHWDTKPELPTMKIDYKS